MKLTPAGNQELKFRDDAAIPAWARDAVATVAKEGLVKGYPQPDGTVTFEAERPVTRAELAVLMARVFGKKLGTVAPVQLKFADAAEIPP
nr:S-layer homology domain-containing protein [Desulfofundulus thermobenzoicus]